ncbi:MAG: BACON domain-containing protein [Bryobacteraceae bacterium]
MIAIAGQNFTVIQNTCTYVLSTSSNVVSAAGGTGAFDVVTSGGCGWTATSNAAWITILAGASGNGTSTVTYQAAANASTASRTGTVTAGGQTHTVTQTSGVTIIQPTANQTIGVSGVSFQWTGNPGATGYDLRVSRAGSTVFQGSLAGAGSTTTLVSLPAGSYTFSVRDCTGGFSDANCGPFASVSFTVSLAAPSVPPAITAPSGGQNFNSSTQTFRWNPVAGADSYEVMLTDMASGGQTELMQLLAGTPPPTETVYSMHSSADYQLKVRACNASCGPWSNPVDFSVSLPAVPNQAPPAPSCFLSSGNSAVCTWQPVTGADFYVLQILQPNAGPGGGVLTVASRRTTATAIAPGEALPLPPGQAFALVSACNGNGCSPPSAGSELNPAGPNPNAPMLGNPISGSTTDGTDVFFSWNRVPGDNGSNTVYRLFALDFSSGRTALDVLTTSNFYAAKFRGGGARHDALVIANPDQPNQVGGPASAFIVRGSSPATPTLTQPRHQTSEVSATIRQGNIMLGWTPVSGATLYEYFVAKAGDLSPAVRGVTPGLFVQVPLAAQGGITTYSGIVRACPAGASCAFGSDAGWGPWSNAPGGPGVTTFRVAP